MLARRAHNFIDHQNITLQNLLVKFGGVSRVINSQISFSTASLGTPKVSELPRKLHKSERKPLVVGINELKRRARLEKQMRLDVQEIVLKPPENGLLVERLVPVARKVFDARTEVFNCVSKVMESIPVYFCRLCEEVHVGKVPNMIRTCDGPGSPTTKEHSWVRGGTEKVLPIVEAFHLYDRLGRAVSHAERLQVDRVPAVLELCMQAGMDIPEYPIRRRAFPVYNISGRLIDFERRFPKMDLSGKDIETFGFWEKREKPKVQSHIKVMRPNDLQGFATRGMKAWEKMRLGALTLMQKYPVQTCGFCPEVQVGPKGHRVRQCQAFKHQMRAGQHAWQEATIDDLVPPVYVWHVPDPGSDDPLVNRLKKYYGKLPAVVELFAQAGAQVGKNYSVVSREDVAVPVLDEEKWAV